MGKGVFWRFRRNQQDDSTETPKTMENLNDRTDRVSAEAHADFVDEVHAPENADTDGGPVVLTALAEYPPETLLGTMAVAQALGSSPRTLRRMVDRGEIPPGTPLGGRKVWQVGQLRDFINERAAKLAEESRRHSARLRDLR